jgi:hypothetical protein
MANTAFCPSYAHIPDPAKLEVLAAMAVAIAKFESGYDPSEHYHEPMGYDSIGLFQLSYEDHFSWCRMDRATRSLEDPIVNIQCAVGEMTRLVARDGVIAAGANSSDARGLARYWSTVRLGPSHKLAAVQKLVGGQPGCQ